MSAKACLRQLISDFRIPMIGGPLSLRAEAFGICIFEFILLATVKIRGCFGSQEKIAE
jgi:hypothetical protein